jgi:hypothetical protein
MITESELWKTELDRISKKLLLRIIQKKWSRRSIFNLEKELFLGFFSIRKLIESEHISKELADKKYELIFFAKINLSKEEIDNILPYSSNDASKKQLTIRTICNQFIHSYHLIPFSTEGKLLGLFINSDFQKKRGIYLILLFHIVEIFRLCADKKGLVDS